MRPEKAYKNMRFLTSGEARTIRMLCEYEEPAQRFKARGIDRTIVFFGSARTLPPQTAGTRLEQALQALEQADVDGRAAAEQAVEAARRKVAMSRFYADAHDLSRRLTKWNQERKGPAEYVICSGGGPGIMEAANRGASEVEGGRSIGLCISLPFEEEVNAYVTEGLAFEFHYFFMRKYWFVFPAWGLVAFPGGFGTLDELFECMTLRQTQKLERPVPIVLYGSDYWRRILNLEAMVEAGTISPGDVDLFHFSDSPEDAFQHLTTAIGEIERQGWGDGFRSNRRSWRRP